MRIMSRILTTSLPQDYTVTLVGSYAILMD